MNNNIKIICENRKASYDYFILDRYEAGLVLKGSEIKSIRKGSVNIKDSYVTIKNSEAFLINANIAIYKESNIFNHDPYRTRKLLLHKHEIIKLSRKVKEDGLTIVPLKIYLSKGKAKIEIALVKGKHNYDKREDQKIKSINKTVREASKVRF